MRHEWTNQKADILGTHGDYQAVSPSCAISNLVKKNTSIDLAWWPWLGTMMMVMAIAGCTETTTPPAAVVVDSPVHDFGECHQGEELSHTFEVANQMDVPVKIIKAISSCSCIVAGKDVTLPDTTIVPHDTMQIPVRFHIGSRQDVASGRIVVHYRMENGSDDSPYKKYLDLRLRAKVIPDYRITPRELDFGEIDGLLTQHATRTLQVVPETTKGVMIEKVSTTSDFITTRIIPKSGNNGKYKIEVNLDVSGFPESRSISGSLVISTDSKQLPEAVVGVRAKYLSPATIDPTMIVIGSDQEGEVSRELSVSSSRPSRIRSVSSHSDTIRAEFDAHQQLRKHRIQLSVAPCCQEALDDELKIELELFPDNGNSLIRAFTVPIHRFFREGE